MSLWEDFCDCSCSWAEAAVKLLPGFSVPPMPCSSHGATCSRELLYQLWSGVKAVGLILAQDIHARLGVGSEWQWCHLVGLQVSAWGSQPEPGPPTATGMGPYLMCSELEITLKLIWVEFYSKSVQGCTGPWNPFTLKAMGNWPNQMIWIKVKPNSMNLLSRAMIRKLIFINFPSSRLLGALAWWVFNAF